MENKTLTRDKVKKLGFKDVPDPTPGNTLFFNLSLGRCLALTYLGTDKEKLTITTSKDGIIRHHVDLWEYTEYGNITEEKLKSLLNFFKNEK